MLPNQPGDCRQASPSAAPLQHTSRAFSCRAQLPAAPGLTVTHFPAPAAAAGGRVGWEAAWAGSGPRAGHLQCSGARDESAGDRNAFEAHIRSRLTQPQPGPSR